MNIVIDVTPLAEFFALPPDQQILIFLLRIGWIPIAIAFLWGVKEAWLFWRSNLWGGNLKYVLVAIDIPRSNDQSLRAVENLFSYLGGAHDPSDLIEKYWIGKYQLNFSFEIVSIEGYIQYLVKMPVQYRDILEAAVYSQYPDAEITEVEDYVDAVPTVYPDDEYDIWGGEMVLSRDEVYPILTYKNFEHQMGVPEKQFKDPLAVLMDTFSSMKKGEQLWYQILVYPTDVNKLEEKGRQEIGKILKEKTSSSSGGMFGGVFSEIKDIFLGVIQELTGNVAFGPKENSTKDESLKMMNLKPKEKKQVEAIQQKVSKQVFETKIRFIYVAKKEVMNKPKATWGFIGFMKQFLDVDLNGLKPDMKITITTAHYLLVDWRKAERKTKLMAAYKGRSGTRGRTRFMMNTEELATLWHVPIEAVVRAPLIQKAPGRKAEPPISLPIGEEAVGEEIFETDLLNNDSIFEDKEEKKDETRQPEVVPPVSSEKPASPSKMQETEDEMFKNKGEPPANLPFV